MEIIEGKSYSVHKSTGFILMPVNPKELHGGGGLFFHNPSTGRYVAMCGKTLNDLILAGASIHELSEIATRLSYHQRVQHPQGSINVPTKVAQFDKELQASDVFTHVYAIKTPINDALIMNGRGHATIFLESDLTYAQFPERYFSQTKHRDKSEVRSAIDRAVVQALTKFKDVGLKANVKIPLPFMFEFKDKRWYLNIPSYTCGIKPTVNHCLLEATFASGVSLVKPVLITDSNSWNYTTFNTHGLGSNKSRTVLTREQFDALEFKAYQSTKTGSHKSLDSYGEGAVLVNKFNDKNIAHTLGGLAGSYLIDSGDGKSTFFPAEHGLDITLRDVSKLMNVNNLFIRDGDEWIDITPDKTLLELQGDLEKLAEARTDKFENAIGNIVWTQCVTYPLLMEITDLSMGGGELPGISFISRSNTALLNVDSIVGIPEKFNLHFTKSA